MKESNYPKFRKGTRVRIKRDIKAPLEIGDVRLTRVPEWMDQGVVIKNPPPGNDYYEFPLVEFDNGYREHVPDTILERANPYSNYLRAVCKCHRVIRASEETLNGAAILCSKCGKEFTTE